MFYYKMISLILKMEIFIQFALYCKYSPIWLSRSFWTTLYSRQHIYESRALHNSVLNEFLKSYLSYQIGKRNSFERHLKTECRGNMEHWITLNFKITMFKTVKATRRRRPSLKEKLLKKRYFPRKGKVILSFHSNFCLTC